MLPILFLLDDVYEDLELWYPLLRLQEEGHRTEIAATALKQYEGKHGYPALSTVLIADVQSGDYDGIVIPGGFMPDKLRRDPKVLSLTRSFHAEGKMVAFICHGGWIPISAGILRGKKATGSLGIKDDLENAGAVWVDDAVVVDGNLVSSRTPKDLPDFGRAIVNYLKTHAPAPAR